MWKIYYIDESTYIGNPYQAPGRGVMVISQTDPDCGKFLIHNFDYYWYIQEGDYWEGGDIFGLYDYLLDLGCKKVIFGKIVKNEKFQEIYKKAYEDDELPKKTAYAYKEKIV